MNTPVQKLTLQSLYPRLTPEEARLAEERIEAYLALVIRIYKRISQDPHALAELRAALDISQKDNPDEALTGQP